MTPTKREDKLEVTKFWQVWQIVAIGFGGNGSIFLTMWTSTYIKTNLFFPCKVF